MTHALTHPFRFIAILLALLTPAAAIAAPKDRTPPTTPTNFRVTGVSSTSVNLAWNPSTDNSGSFFYVFFSGTTAIANASMTATTQTITGLAPNTTYTFRMRARDHAMNWSAYSNTVTFTTLPANTVPNAPVLAATAGPTHITLSWTAPSNAPPPHRYWIYRDGVQIVAAHQTTSITFYLLNPGTTHTYTVRVRDGNVQFSDHSNAVTVTTPQPDPNDNTPPSTPTGLWEEHFGDAEFWLRFTESTDNVTPQDIIRYDVYVNGVLSDIVVGDNRSINYGNQGQVNTVDIIAIDEAGNASPPATLTFFLN